MSDNTGQDDGDRVRPAGGSSGRTVVPDDVSGRMMGYEGSGSSGAFSETRFPPGDANVKQKVSRHYWLVPVDRDLMR